MELLGLTCGDSITPNLHAQGHWLGFTIARDIPSHIATFTCHGPHAAINTRHTEGKRKE